MLESYIPILMQIVIACGFAGSTLGMSVLLGKSGARGGIKETAYECGMLPVGNSQPRFSVKFYLVAMLFVIFDIEVVFMYPWATVFRDFVAGGNTMIFWSMLSFAGILGVAYLYVLKKRAFDWSR